MASFLASSSQLLSLIAFVSFIIFLNNRRPSGTNYKPFKLLQCLSILFVALSILYLFQLIGGVELLIEQSPSHLKNFISAQQGVCLKHRDNGEYHLAEKAIRDRSLLKSLLKEEKFEAKQSRGQAGGSGLLSNDWLNFLLFNTGVSVTVLPALLQLLFRIFIHNKSAANATPEQRDAHHAKLRREWGILLPIINHTTLLSFLTTFTFFFNVEGQRADKCIFTSGHWYTFICSLLTFCWIMAHLWSYSQSSAGAFRLLIVYSVYTAMYSNFALTVLKNTQRYHHDATEAHDGIRSAIRVFIVFLLPLLLMQYILYQWSKTKPSRQRRSQEEIPPPAYDEGDQSQADHYRAPPSYSSAADAAAAPLHIPAPPSVSSVSSIPSNAPSFSNDIPAAPEAPIAPPAPEAPLSPPIAPSAPSAPAAPPAPPAPSASSSDPSVSASALNDARSRLRASASSSESKSSSSSSDSGRPFSATDLQNSRGKLRPASNRAAASSSSKDDSMMAALKARLAAARPFLEPGAEEDDKEWEVI